MQPPVIHFAPNGTGIGFGNVRPPVNLTSGRETLGIVQGVQQPIMGASKHIQSAIHAPSLTDPSQIGFSAVRTIPFAAKLRQRLGIAIRTPSVFHLPPPSGSVRPTSAAIPVPVRRMIGRARLFANRLIPR